MIVGRLGVRVAPAGRAPEIGIEDPGWERDGAAPQACHQPFFYVPPFHVPTLP